MADHRLRDEFPRWLVPAVAALMLATFAYSVLITANILVWFALWSTVLGLALTVFVVYLLYRLVVAVEEIAEKT
ncbi:hypothetical protein [Halorientalis marina]|jgi:hypothetical protein|uniref:hypothetical protein n=1 Tax=Halorientalis marina TaxID=2931976 RepID=UPI001FF48B0B|nr:hypothetical protein [Halorientalis marina]